MRQILVDKAGSPRIQTRRRPAADLATAADAEQKQGADLLALNEALEALAEVDPKRSQIVELRFFGGLTVKKLRSHGRVSATVDVTGASLAHGCKQSWVSPFSNDSRQTPNDPRPL